MRPANPMQRSATVNQRLFSGRLAGSFRLTSREGVCAHTGRTALLPHQHLLPRLVFGDDLSNELLDDVFHREQSQELAVLADNEGEPRPAGL
jgi:hypothetical protein